MSTNTKVIDNETLSYILINMSEMLESGINILNVMDIIENTIIGSNNKILIKNVKENIKIGYSISEAFGIENSIPILCKEMISIGEGTGKLNCILILLSNYYKKLSFFKKQIIGSLIYPMIIIGLMIGVITLLFITLIPSFIEMYNSLEINPAGITKFIFAMRKNADENILIFSIYILFYVIIIPSICIMQIAKSILKRNLVNIKIVNHYREYIVLMILYLIFESGINIQRAFLEFSREIKTPLINNSLNEIGESLLRGQSLKYILERQEIFSKYTLAMVSIGEETGKLSDNINRALLKREDELINRTKKITAIIQPTLIFVISIIIVMIILSFLMPLYEGINI